MFEANLNAAILQFLRNAGRAVTVRELVEYLVAQHIVSRESLAANFTGSRPTGVDVPDDSGVVPQLLVKRLTQLAELGLLALQPPDTTKFRLLRTGVPEYDRKVQIAPSFVDFQRAIGFSLTEAATRTPNSLQVSPVFAFPKRHSLDVFVMMPFAPQFDATYSAITACCEALKLVVKRGDDLFRASHIIHDVWSMIVSAKLIVCDCTSQNPNVFYELGIAHTLGKPVVLITQNANDVPFDLRQWRYLLYDESRATLADGLRGYLQEAGLA
jgi:hypothetical protein